MAGSRQGPLSQNRPPDPEPPKHHLLGGMKSLERFTKMSQPCRVLHSLKWDPLKCRRAVLKSQQQFRWP